MKKRIVALLLVAVLGLTACGGNTNKPNTSEKPSTESTETEKNEVQTEQESETEEVKLSYWETKQVNTPKLGDVTVEEVQAFENVDVKTKMYTTFLNMTQDDLLKALQNSKYINDKFELAKGTYEDIECTVYGDVGEQAKIIEQKYISGGPKGSSQVDKGLFYDLDFRLTRDTYQFNTPQKLSLTLHDIEITKEVQVEMLKILSDVLGEEIANYIVYAEDIDGKTVSGDRLEECQLSDLVAAGEYNYLFYRSIAYDKEKPMESDIYFYIQLDRSNIKKIVEYDTNGYSSVSNDMKYTIASALNNSVFIDKTKYTTLFSDYMKLVDAKYIRTLIDNIYIDYEQGLNGINRGQIDIESKCGIEDVANIISPELNIDFEYAEKDSEIIDMELSIEGESMFEFNNQFDTEEAKEEAFKGMIADVAVQIKKLFPDLDTSFITYDTCRKGHIENTTYTLFGKEYKMKIDIKCGGTFADTIMAKYEITIE